MAANREFFLYDEPELVLDMYDHDDFGQDDFLGRAVIKGSEALFLLSGKAGGRRRLNLQPRANVAADYKPKPKRSASSFLPKMGGSSTHHFGLGWSHHSSPKSGGKGGGKSGGKGGGTSGSTGTAAHDAEDEATTEQGSDQIQIYETVSDSGEPLVTGSISLLLELEDEPSLATEIRRWGLDHHLTFPCLVVEIQRCLDQPGPNPTLMLQAKQQAQADAEARAAAEARGELAAGGEVKESGKGAAERRLKRAERKPQTVGGALAKTLGSGLAQVQSLGATISSHITSVLAPTAGHLVFQPYIPRDRAHAHEHSGGEDASPGGGGGVSGEGGGSAAAKPPPLLLSNLASRNVDVAPGGAMRWEHPPDVFLVRIGDDEQHFTLESTARSKATAHAWGMGDPHHHGLEIFPCLRQPVWLTPPKYMLNKRERPKHEFFSVGLDVEVQHTQAGGGMISGLLGVGASSSSGESSSSSSSSESEDWEGAEDESSESSASSGSEALSLTSFAEEVRQRRKQGDRATAKATLVLPVDGQYRSDYALLAHTSSKDKQKAARPSRPSGLGMAKTFVADLRGKGEHGERGDEEEDPEAEARAAVAAELEEARRREEEAEAKAKREHEYAHPPQWGTLALRSVAMAPLDDGAPPGAPANATPSLSKNPGHRPGAGEGVRFRLQLVGLESLLPTPPAPAASRASTAARAVSDGLSAGLGSAKKAARRASNVFTTDDGATKGGGDQATLGGKPEPPPQHRHSPYVCQIRFGDDPTAPSVTVPLPHWSKFDGSDAKVDDPITVSLELPHTLHRERW